MKVKRKCDKFLILILVLSLSGISNISTAAESDEMNPFEVFDMPQQMIDERTNSFIKKLTIAASYGLGQTGSLMDIVKAVFPPYSGEEYISDKYYDEAMELIIEEMVNDQTFCDKLATGIFEEFDSDIDSASTMVDVADTIADHYGSFELNLSEDALGNISEIMMIGEGVSDYLSATFAENYKYMEMIESFDNTLPSNANKQVVEATFRYKLKAADLVRSSLEGSIETLSEYLTEAILKNSTEIGSKAAQNVLLGVKVVGGIGNYLLGGEENSSAIIRGLQLNIIELDVHSGYLEALIEVKSNPTEENYQKLYDAFYVYKSVVLAHHRNTLDMKLTNAERSNVLTGIELVEKMDYYTVFGIEELNYTDMFDGIISVNTGVEETISNNDAIEKVENKPIEDTIFTTMYVNYYSSGDYSLNLRASANNGTVIKAYKSGTEVQANLQGQVNGWVPVKIDGNEGWMYGMYLVEGYNYTTRKYIDYERDDYQVNLRETADNGEIIDAFKTGTEIYIDESNACGSWVPAKIGDIAGWIYSPLLRDNK